jgi:CheY-like chemotaxis protein
MGSTTDREPTPTHLEGASLLLVSTDESLTSELELLLASRAQCVVETAADAAGALEVLSRSRVDLILLHVRMEGEDPLRFLRTCREHRRMATLPVLVILEADESDAVVRVLDEGAHDVVSFPCPMGELAARVRAHLRTSVERRRKLTGRRYNLSGDFTALGFTDLVGLLELGNVTGRLSILSVHGEGFLYFEAGRITHVVYGNIEGEEAFYALMLQKTAQFEFCPGDWVADAALPRTIDGSIAGLVMEGARRFDETSPGTTREAAGRADANPLAELDAAAEVLAPPMAPSAQMATQVEVQLGSRRALGELKLMTRSQLRAWTADAQSHGRLHCFLVGDLQSGAQALSAIAVPLPDEQIANALRHYPQALAWTMSLDAGRRVEIVLIDQDRPRAVLESLCRRPAVIIVAPSHGDFQTINLESRHALMEMMSRMAPLALMGVGNADLEAQLKEFAAMSSCDVPVAAMVGSLWNLGVDPRLMVVEALRLWSKAPVPQA